MAQIASYPHFKWLSSFFKWLSICQASETCVCVITLLTLNTSHLTISPLHFSPSNNEANFPVYSAATAHLNCARKKELKITFNSDHTQTSISSFLLSSLLCVIQATGA